MTADVLLISKRDRWSLRAGAYAQRAFGDALDWRQGALGEPFPLAQAQGAGRYRIVLSFLSPWIVPARLLETAELAINFHPGSCDYPGIGCYNFALYEGAESYGVVCHHMLAEVDAGEIIEERRFPLGPEDTVETLKLKSMTAMAGLFERIVGRVAEGTPLPASSAQWTRKAFTRRQLNELCVITTNMDANEIKRRVRAVTYPGQPGAQITLAGHRFAIAPEAREPLA